jgi:DNA-binding MarR family transcriptional regulator
MLFALAFPVTYDVQLYVVVRRKSKRANGNICRAPSLTVEVMSRRSLKKEEYEALASFRHALRRFLKFSEEAARAVGLTPQQHQALLAIKGAGSDSITNGELAERLQIKHHSAVGLINRLARMGLVRRERDREDRRKVRVRLTPKGTAILERLTEAHRDELRSIAPHLRSILKRITDG